MMLLKMVHKVADFIDIVGEFETCDKNILKGASDRARQCQMQWFHLEINEEKRPWVWVEILTEACWIYVRDL